MTQPHRAKEVTLDLDKFFNACNPGNPLILEKAENKVFYIDFSSSRGDKFVDSIVRTIVKMLPNEPTFHLLTGHPGCGKSTELLRLKHELEQQNFYVVYFEINQDFSQNKADLENWILLEIARNIVEKLKVLGINLKPGAFAKAFKRLVDILYRPIKIKFELEKDIPLVGKSKVAVEEAEDSPKLSNQLWEYLESPTSSLVQSINQEILVRAKGELQQRGKTGLVVIVDNLDRIDDKADSLQRSQAEYLFIDRGEQLRRLNCHMIYTMPLSLIFSNELSALKNYVAGGVDPKVLWMVPVQLKDGTDCKEGMDLLQKMVLVRAFPTLDFSNIDNEKRLRLITKVFDTPDTFDRLCRVSGGHLKQLLEILFRCLDREKPPLSRECIEIEIQKYCSNLLLGLTEDVWNLLCQVVQQQGVNKEEEKPIILQSMKNRFLFKYSDRRSTWYSINPALVEAKKLK